MASAAQAGTPALPEEQAHWLSTISANTLRGNLSFLASDALEGRGTPSRGLDIAAEYIAAQFRAAGLEPLGDDGYFQTADWREIAPKREIAKYADAPQPLKVRNVVGLLRGSDPELSKTYVLVTAHYDHLGVREGNGDDAIYNGANDDGSGTVLTMELARVFAESGVQFDEMVVTALCDLMLYDPSSQTDEVPEEVAAETTPPEVGDVAA